MLARIKKSWSIRMAADRALVTIPTVRSVERTGQARLETLRALAGAFGATLHARPCHDRGAFAGPGGTAYSSAFHGWTTPPEVLETLARAGFEFDLDPASPGRGLSPVPARVHLTAADDGLSADWSCSTSGVFVNPPYGRVLRDWVAKCASEAARGAKVCGLVPARTDTGWWHTSVAGTAHVVFLRGRLRFGGAQNDAPFPSALVLWGYDLSMAQRLTALLPGAWMAPAAVPTVAA